MTHYDHVQQQRDTKQSCLDSIEQGAVTCGEWFEGRVEDITQATRDRLKAQIDELNWYLGKMGEQDQRAQ